MEIEPLLPRPLDSPGQGGAKIGSLIRDGACPYEVVCGLHLGVTPAEQHQASPFKSDYFITMVLEDPLLF